MKTSLKLSLAVAAIAATIAGSSAPVLARDDQVALDQVWNHAARRQFAASIMNSPGYQRRLQESRQQASQPDAQPSSAHRGHKSRHPKRH